MLDLLLEALLDAITGKQPKKAAPPRRRRQSEDGRRTESPAAPPPAQVRREEPEEQPGQPETYTFEDLIRKMTGMEEEAPPPRQQSRRQRSSREERRETVQAAPPPPPPPPPPQPARSLVSETLDNIIEDRLPLRSRTARIESDYAARLRGNPRAARDAFVYGEIFGRPLAERDHLP